MGSASDAGRVVGRYVLYDEIASGGMATIHLGRMLGQVGFARTVAIKRLHPHFARDPEFVAMFIDEARLAAGIRHPNVVSTLDVVALEGDLFLVMEYIEGDSLSHLAKRAQAAGVSIPPAVVSGILTQVLYGLHAAHTAKDDRGEPLHIVHRDVSPQNVLVGLDGVARVVDFGVAKAARRIQETEAGRIKGKFRYMAPEQVRADRFDHRVDVFAAGIVLWEALAGRGLFVAEEPMRTMTMVLEHPIEPPSSLNPALSPAVDEVVLRALARVPDERYATAREMAIALEDVLPPAVPRKTGELVETLVGETLKRRAARLIELGSESSATAVESVPSFTAAAPEPAPAPPPPPAAAPALAQPETTPMPVSAPRLEPSSQVSEVSTAAWDTAAQRSLLPLAPSRPTKIVLGAVAASMALFLVVLVLFLKLRSSPDEAPDVLPVSSPRTATPAAPAPTPSPEPVKPEPSGAPEPPPPEPSKRTEERPAPSGKPAPKPASDCNPPWVIDASGIKKFKRHCL